MSVFFFKFTLLFSPFSKDFEVSPLWHELIVSSTIAAALVFSLIGGWFSGLYFQQQTSFILML